MHPFIIEYAPLAIAAFFVGLSKGGLPGIGMIAVPLLALSMSPIAAAAWLLPIFILSDMVAVYLYRQHYDVANLSVLIPAGLAGVGIGWLTASLVSDNTVALLIGLLGVGFCLNVWLRGNATQTAAQPSKIKGALWGTLSGFTSFVAHAGAPTILFTIVNLAKIIPYSAIEPYTTTGLKTSLAFVPFALLGTVVGKYSIVKLNDTWFYRLVQIALFVICVQLIVRSI